MHANNGGVAHPRPGLSHHRQAVRTQFGFQVVAGWRPPVPRWHLETVAWEFLHELHHFGGPTSNT
eukprot:5855232-Lingulodinium_polyedra.AAC.1